MKKKLLFAIMCVLGLFGTLRAQDAVTIDGTIGGWEQGAINYVPIYNNYEYAVTQQYYTAEEIGKSSGTIQSISFKTSNDENYPYTRTFDVYMVNTDNYHFGVGGKTMEQVSASDLVFSGTVEFTQDAWITLELDTEFEYNGSNLLVCVNDYTNSYIANSGSDFEAYISTYELPYQGDTGLARRALYKKSSNTKFEPEASAISGCTLSPFVPYVQLGFAAGSQEYLEPAVPTNVVATADLVSSSITLTWDVAENATSYNVYSGTELLAEKITETTFTISDLAEGTEFCYTVTSVNGPKESAASESACATTRSMLSLVVGEGTESSTQAPFTNGSRYSYTEMFYEAAEIGQAVNIERIAFQYSYGSAMTLSEVKIYMAETDKAGFESTSSWEAEEDLTLVYSGTDVLVGDRGWETFELNEPFLYSGTKNLSIVVAKSSETVNYQLFWVCEDKEDSILFTASDNDATCSQYPAGEGYFYKMRPNVKFLYSDEPLPVPATPANFTATATSATTIELSWNAVEDAASYNIYNGEELVANVTETTYTVEGLTASTEYCYTLTAVNGLESAATEAVCATTKEEGAEEVAVLIVEKFDGFNEGDKIAEKGSAWWTTWSNKPGTAEDGVVAELNGDKCGHLTYNVDQVLLLGGEQAGVYDLEFDIYVPEGKNAYFNILHDFKGTNSTWALESHLHLTGSNTASPEKGFVKAGGQTAEIVCVYDEWMHFRLHVDTDKDVAQYFYTLPEGEETMALEWQWSLNTEGSVVGRKLDAMDFFPPKDAATSEFYLDNFYFTKIGGESYPVITLEQESLEASVDQDDVTSVDLSFKNEGTSVAEYTAWIDYGVGQISQTMHEVNYDRDPSNETEPIGLTGDEPQVIEIGVMFPAEAYGNSVSGTYITHVLYPFLEVVMQGEETGSIGIVEGEPVTFRIYGQGMYGQPGDILAEKVVPYEEIVRNDWTAAEFDEPVALTGFDVWATLTFTQDVITDNTPNYPMMFDGSESVPYGDMFRFDGTGPFYSAKEMFGEDYGNFHLRMVCFGEPVSGGWASLSKTEGALPIGATETVTVDLTSIGLNDGETYKADVVLSTNDPENAMIKVPVSLYVWGENVEEILSETYNVYPNPTNGQVTVEGENINYIAVYNSVGQLVNVVKNQNNIVDMSACENGVYYFSIVDNNGQNSVQRVVVAK